jgi:RimJ/RimL family protein N-acetyltransferase
MQPTELSSALVRLDLPVPADARLVFEYCQDPTFERYLTVPWPYRLSDAEQFLSDYVPRAWANDREYTWALRNPSPSDAELLGVIGLRLPSGTSAGGGDAGGTRDGADDTARAGAAAQDASIGFWLGAPHRGRGYMPEAVRLVAHWAFSTGVTRSIHWECLVGNTASARVAQKSGFSFTGVHSSVMAHRDGSHPSSWQAMLHAADANTVKPDWPGEIFTA